MNELEPTFLASKIEKGIDSVIEKSIDDTALEDYSGSGKSENTLAAVLEGSKDSNATSENPEAYGFNLITLLENPVRTEREAWYIYSRLKNFRFFTQFIENGDEKDKLDSAMYICKKLQYHKHSAGSVIMKQNQYSNGKVYLILSGELLVITADMTGLANTTEQDQTERRGTICEPKEIDKIQIVINESDPNEESPVPRRRRSSVKLNLESHNTLLLPEPTTMTSRKSSLFRELALSPQASSSKPRATINLGQSSGFSDNLNQIVQSQKKQDFLRKPQTMVININQRAKMLKKQTKIDLDRAMVNPDPYGKVVNKIGKGAYFGEKALFTRHKRSATIMANSEVELLTLNQEEFEYVQTEFNKTKKQLLNFISGIFPKLEKLHPVTIENLSYTCDIKNCFFHQTIISEGTRGDEFFIVYDGKLEVMKTLIYDKSDTLNQNMAETKNLYGLKKTAKEQFVIMTMEKGMFFGEEILYDIDPVYEYTVRVSTEKTRLLCFKKSKFLFKCPKKIIDSLHTVYLNKKTENK